MSDRPTKLPRTKKLGTGTRAVRVPTKHAGRDANGELLERPHIWSAAIERECVRLAKRGADCDEIAVIINLRPGQVREHYGHQIDRELALRNLAVEEAMYANAEGFQHRDTHITYDAQRGKHVKLDILKKYPPNQSAASFLLKNRRPGAWRDEPLLGASPDEAAAAIRAKLKAMQEAGG